MNSQRRRALTAFRALADDLGRTYRLTAQADGYRVTDVTPGDVEYVETDWDGSDAEASYPDPSNDDTDLDFLADHYVFVPSTLDADDPPPKSAFKAPIRMGPGGPVNTNALMAVIQAINGARGGFDDVSMDTLRAGFDAAVDHLVAADVYDDADDAPDFDGEASAAEHGGADFDVGATVRWGDGDADVYGIIRDKATSGDDVFADRIDGDFSLSPTEDNPGYLVETLDERDDGWVPSGTMTGHRGETLRPWSPDSDVLDDGDASAGFDVSRTAAGSVTFDVDTDHLTADAADGAALTGIVWGAGDHDLGLGGEPTPVRVPKDTVRPTFDALREDIESGDVTLGFDHPGPDSVAAKTGIVDIGVAKDAALTADGKYIALTDSELMNDQAVEAAQAGDFDDLDWSIVADVAVRRDDSGDVVRDDGRVVLDATRIKRIDAVDTGAVDAASIERGIDPLPDLAAETATVRQAVRNPNQRPDAVQALKASSTAITEMTDPTNFDPNVDDLSDAREQLSAAADIIDDQQDDLEAAKAKAGGFERLLTAHDVDPEDFDSPEAAAQAVIDEQTADTRKEIAELEAELGAYDVSDVEARAQELAGQGRADLQNTLNARKAEAFDRQQTRQQKGRAAAKGDGVGRTDPTGGAGANGSADANDIALQAMDGGDRIEAEARGQSPAEYVSDTYGLNASQYDAADELHRDILDAIGGDA